MTGQHVLPPIFFNPIYKSKIWGGQSLHRTLNKVLPSHERIGESWELSGCIGDASLAKSPPVAGTSLFDLYTAEKTAIAGIHDSNPEFPLLFKFIDANDKLSVQVHPNDEQAVTNGWGNFGKTECWYIVDAMPGAKLICGLKSGVTLDDVAEGVRDSSLERLLNEIPVSAGDTIFVPAGTVHAITEGIVLYEVQESSDTTLRLYDWGRLDDSGKPRDLHVADALRVCDVSYHTRHKIPPLRLGNVYGSQHLYRVVCNYFLVEEYSFPRSIEQPLPEKSSFSVVTVLKGTLNIETSAGKTTVAPGETVLLPACLHHIQTSGEPGVHFLVSSIPDIAADVIVPLRRQGIPDDRIELLGGNPACNDVVRYM